MYSIHAIFLICEVNIELLLGLKVMNILQAYHRGLHLPRHLVLTIGWYSNFWWREDEPGLTCTVEEREKVLANSLVVSDEIFLGDADAINTTGIVIYNYNYDEIYQILAPEHI